MLAEFTFDVRSVASYSARIVARRMLGRRYVRDTTAVIAEYEADRRAWADRWRRGPWDLDEYILSDFDEAVAARYHQLIDGRLTTGAWREARSRFIAHVVRTIMDYKPDSVTEFGCGIGRNLLAIKRALPGAQCAGLELTQSSVQLANEASRYYGLPIEVQQADVTKPLDVKPVDVCYSVHALEQIPDAAGAFEQMRALSRKAVVMWEPVPELYPRTIRGAAGRLRAVHLDRLRGIYSYIKQNGYPVTRIHMLPDATNALNPAIEVHVLVNRTN
jgi:SAM-dependent methyltransferase